MEKQRQSAEVGTYFTGTKQTHKRKKNHNKPRNTRQRQEGEYNKEKTRKETFHCRGRQDQQTVVERKEGGLQGEQETNHDQ